MNFEQLSTSHQGLTGERRNHGEQLCEQAYEFLAKAQLEDFQNKRLLQQASQCFIQALRRNRNQVEPYIGLGYIHILVSDFNGAQKFLQQALKQDPENASAQELMTYTKTPFVPEVKQKSAHELTEKEFDQLYDKVESSIVQLIQKLMAYPLNKPPTLAPSELEALQTQFGQFNSAVNELHEQIDILEHEFDITEIRTKIIPLERGLKRYERYMALSKQFQGIYRQIMVTTKKVSATLLSIKGHEAMSELENQINQYMDSCDHIADQLDALDNQRIPIQSLEKPYKALIEMVEQLHDAADGLET